MCAIMYTSFQNSKMLEKYKIIIEITNKHAVHIIAVNNCNLPKKYRILVLHVDNSNYKKIDIKVIHKVIHNIHRKVRKIKVCYKHVT